MNLLHKLRRELARATKPRPRRGESLRRQIRISCPFLLISQIKRSGGTLLSQLFDGHPEIYAHPGELHIGKPKWVWPELDLHRSTPAQLWKALYEHSSDTYVRNGYYKYGKVEEAQREYFPFVFNRAGQKRAFLENLAAHGAETPRQVMDAYWSSYFCSWYDYQNMYGGDKRYIMGFAANMAMYPDSIERYFQCYPDGHLLCVVRDPWSWIPSAVRHEEKLSDPQAAIRQWTDSVRGILGHAARFPDRVIVLDFRDLVQETGRVMRDLSLRLGLTWSESLTRPTFNSMPIRANSSFREKCAHGVVDARQSKAAFPEHACVTPEIAQLYDATKSLTGCARAA